MSLNGRIWEEIPWISSRSMHITPEFPQTDWDKLIVFYIHPLYVFYYFEAWCRTGFDSLRIDHVAGISGIALYEKMSS